MYTDPYNFSLHLGYDKVSLLGGERSDLSGYNQCESLLQDIHLQYNECSLGDYGNSHYLHSLAYAGNHV